MILASFYCSQETKLTSSHFQLNAAQKRGNRADARRTVFATPHRKHVVASGSIDFYRGYRFLHKSYTDLKIFQRVG